ncbi:uncharacterized protein LOC123547510 [Mercenaria mercenaria]|uniref:uncharacterized protein LOC123547510 n=1 Tax=Mercenaria mercenaria TaxID=6596 RepID=UPI00234FB130|nr:uncharacterized protein LOC123547510 [Mercenaria mercenaria]
MVSIGTNVFDQKSVILTKGSKYYSWFSTVVCMWSLLIILYFVWKILTSLHGCTDEFADRRARSSGSRQECHVLTRPDLIPVGTGDLNLFRSYFFSTLFEGKGVCSSVVFILSCIVWLSSIIAFFELIPELIAINKKVCILMFIICSIYSVSVIPVVVIFVLCFSLIMFSPNVLISWDVFDVFRNYEIFYMLTNYELSNSHLYDFVLLISCWVMLIVLFSYDKWFLHLMLNGDLIHKLLWLTWPVQFIVFLTKLVKRFYSLSDTSLHMIWLGIVSALFYLGIFVVPQNVGDRTFSYDPKYLHVLSYWLFFPIYFIFRTFCIAYTKTISLAVEAVFTTFFIAYLCNFLLPWLYPSLKLLKEKDLFLYAILTLTLVTHLLKIYREWYDKYDTFLKAVVSYVRNKYKCTENQTELERKEDSISLVYNHTDDSACQDLEEN